MHGWFEKRRTLCHSHQPGNRCPLDVRIPRGSQFWGYRQSWRFFLKSRLLGGSGYTNGLVGAWMFLNFEKLCTLPRFKKHVFGARVSAKKAHFQPKPLDTPDRNFKWRANCQSRGSKKGPQPLIFWKKYFWHIRTVRKRALARFVHFDANPPTRLRIQHGSISHP